MRGGLWRLRRGLLDLFGMLLSLWVDAFLGLTALFSDLKCHARISLFRLILNRLLLISTVM
jgi:hypothetical protein